jgi:hypothetical protein
MGNSQNFWKSCTYKQNLPVPQHWAEVCVAPGKCSHSSLTQGRNYTDVFKQVELRSVVWPDASNVQRLALNLKTYDSIAQARERLDRVITTYSCNPLGV